MNQKILQAAQAMFKTSSPVNPWPFAQALKDYLDQGGNITDRLARQILYTLTSTLFGQLFSLELVPNPQAKTPQATLQEMLAMPALPRPVEAWKALLPSIIECAIAPKKVYSATSEYAHIKDLENEHINVVFWQRQAGAPQYLHTWETSLPQSEEAMKEAVYATGLVQDTDEPVHFQMENADTEEILSKGQLT